MVVEITGSTVLLGLAVVAGVAVSAAIIMNAQQVGAGATMDISISAWDRFDTGNMLWVDIGVTHEGGAIVVSGDLVDGKGICLSRQGSGCPAGTQQMSTCLDPDMNHGCVSFVPVGNSLIARYTGVVDAGFPVERGDALGYIVSSGDHAQSGMVVVR